MAKSEGSSKPAALLFAGSPAVLATATATRASSGRASSKRKNDDTGDNETNGTAKKLKTETRPARAKPSSGAVGQWTKKGPVEIQLKLVRTSGGEDEYRDAHEKIFRDRMDEYDEDEDYEGYYEAKQDLYAFQDGRLDTDYDDPEMESIQYRSEYHVAVETAEGEDVGHVKFLVADLTDAEFHHFWAVFECHSPAVSRFLSVFAEDDPAYSGFYDGGHSEGPLLKVDVQAAGTKCWSRHEFTAYRKDPLVYILEFVVKDKWQGQGVGSQIYEALSSLEPVRRAKYFFAMPGPLEPMPKSQGVKQWVERGRRIRAFHRQVGFRRVGNSHFFARAVDTKHPSRAIKPGEDAGYVPVGEMPEVKRKATMYAFA
ncbi:unnamed protein product [Peniophora sp. CBMAI 1063]|nr:unnamed protein product [Peniophora sp. CBMAI 1063]